MASIEERRMFSHIWKSPAPSKVVEFSWKLLHDWIPTKVNLWHKQVLPPDTSVSCVLCEGNAESVNHLFIHCKFAMEVWKGVWRWFDVFLGASAEFVPVVGGLE